MSHEPMVECTYGWGHVLRLYQDHLDLNGTCYALNELVYANPVYRSVFGVSSIRLELRFRGEMVVLRGIIALEKVRAIVAYLNSRSLVAPPLKPGAGQTSLVLKGSAAALSLVSQPLPREADPVIIASYDVSPDKFIEPYVAPFARLPRQQWHIQESLERRLKSLRAERVQHEHGFDVERLAQLLRQGLLPQVRVPVRLLFDENAYYSTEATLSSEVCTVAGHYPRQGKDQGMLVLTSKRIIYLGRKRQLILGYEQLLQVTRLRGAIMLFARQWSHREIFEIRRPLECIMYLECILQRFQQQVINNGDTQPQAIPMPTVQEALAASVLPTTEPPAQELHDAETLALALPPWLLEENGQAAGQRDKAGGRQDRPDIWQREAPGHVPEDDLIEVPEEFRELVEWSYRVAGKRERGEFDD